MSIKRKQMFMRARKKQSQQHWTYLNDEWNLDASEQTRSDTLQDSTKTNKPTPMPNTRTIAWLRCVPGWMWIWPRMESLWPSVCLLFLLLRALWLRSPWILSNTNTLWILSLCFCWKHSIKLKKMLVNFKSKKTTRSMLRNHNGTINQSNHRSCEQNKFFCSAPFWKGKNVFPPLANGFTFGSQQTMLAKKRWKIMINF